jgi:spore germination protein GerM
MDAKKKKRKGKRKSRLGKVLFRLILLIAITGLIVFGLVKLWGWVSGLVTGNLETVKVYFYDDVLGVIVPVERKVDTGGNMAEAVVAELCKGPNPSDHASRTLAPDTVVHSVTIGDDKIATVNLSSQAKTPVPPCTEESSIYSVANTLCSLEGIDAVRIQIDSQTPPFYWNSFELNTEYRMLEVRIPPTEEMYAYFPEKRNRYVAVENVLVRKTDGVLERARLVMARYLQGPKLAALRNPMPPTVKMPGMSFSGNTLTIDFSSNGLTLGVDAKGELLFLQSLVWTLTDVKNVNKVKIFVDGKPVSSIGGHISTLEAFTRLDPRLIENPGESIGNASLVFFAGDFGDGIYALVPRTRFLSGPDFDREPLDRLFASPDPTEKELGLITCLPVDMGLVKTVFGQSDIAIHLTVEATKTPNSAIESTFVNQIIMTATDNQEHRIKQVIFYVDDETREDLPNGTPISKRQRYQ